MHIQSKLLQHMFVVGASSDLGQSFRPRQKIRFGEVTEQVSRYDIHAEGAFPPSVSNHDNESKKPELLNLQCFSEIINSKQKCMRLQFLKVTVALNGRKEMFYLTTHSTHCIYGYMASDIW